MAAHASGHAAANRFLSAQICENYGPNLDTCPEGTVLGLLVDSNNCLHLHVNGMDQGVAAQDIPSPCYPFIDLYGQCEQVRTGQFKLDGLN